MSEGRWEWKWGMRRLVYRKFLVWVRAVYMVVREGKD